MIAATITAFLFVVYLLFSCQIALVLLGSSNHWFRKAYWLLPFVLSFTIAASIPGKTTFINEFVVFCVLSLIFQGLMYGYIFRCLDCGATENTYRRWWRKGVQWCPGCRRPYINGK